jgi:hypothetical protein
LKASQFWENTQGNSDELLEYLELYKPSKIMALQVILKIDIKSVNTLG